MKNIVVILIVIVPNWFFSQSKQFFYETALKYDSPKSVTLESSEKQKLNNLAEMIKNDSSYSFELILVNEFYVDFKNEYKIDKKRVTEIGNYIKSLGVKKEQCYCSMSKNKLKLMISPEESKYFDDKTKHDKEYIQKNKLLVVRKLTRIK